MKINYEKVKQLNIESLTINCLNGNVNENVLTGHNNTLTTNLNSIDQLSCYWLIHSGVEKYLNGETLSQPYIDLLVDVGVLVLEPEERKNIVKPFRMDVDNGSQGN